MDADARAAANADKTRQQETQRLLAHHMSLGELCMTWAALDHMVDALFAPLLQCSKGQVASVVTNVENLSSRCEILKRLIHLEAPSDQWREWFVALLDRVSNELAPLRNRYIHDYWDVKITGITRLDKRAKIGKPQSREAPILTFNTKHVTDPQEVAKLNQRCVAVLVGLSVAGQNLAIWRKTGRPLEPDDLWLPLSKPRARYLIPLEYLELLGSKRPPDGVVFD